MTGELLFFVVRQLCFLGFALFFSHSRWQEYQAGHHRSDQIFAVLFGIFAGTHIAFILIALIFKRMPY